MKRIAIASALVALPLVASGAPSGLPAPDNAKELEALQGAIGRFEEANKDYRGTISHVVQQEYVEKRKQLMAKYQQQLDVEERDEKLRRESAIRLFEDF